MMANEQRLIDANALCKGIEKRYCEPCKAEGKDYHEVACRACWVDDMRIEVEDAPTVEVVHCKDCKHRYNGKDCTHPLLLSYSWGAIRKVKDDDFCSYGERRTNDLP